MDVGTGGNTDEGRMREVGAGGGNAGALRTAGGHQKLGEGRGAVSSWSLRRERGPAGTLIFRFCLQNYIVFSPPQFVVLSYGSPRELTLNRGH